MKTKSLILLGISILMLISSCTIQKRRYRKGYYVNWNKNYSKNNTSVTKELKVNKTKQNKAITIKKASTAQEINPSIPEEKEVINDLTSTIDTTNETTKKLNLKKTDVVVNFNTDIKQNEITSDSTKVNSEVDKTQPTKVKNKSLSIAIILTILSVWLFIFGGFIAIIIAYFLAIKALKQIRNQPEIYKEKEQRKAKIIIYGYNIFFMSIFIITSILAIFSSSLFFIFVVVSGIYSILGLIGLLSLHYTKKRSQKNKIKSKTVENDKRKEDDKKERQKSNNVLPLFLLAVILTFGIYYLVNM